MNGGDRVAEVLKERGVPFLFTLCGGHISPILVSAKARGIRVVDVRHEVTAVFAADAVARLTGVPGVAAVTAGPGATNTITALKNAQLAQSPLVLLVGATATALKGRGSLQDIDQVSLLKPHVKWMGTASRVRDLASLVDRGFERALSGVPGPVCIECPVDLLYEESLVRKWYGEKTPGGSGLTDRALRWYLRRHVNRLFSGADEPLAIESRASHPPEPPERYAHRTFELLTRARKPLMLVGSQALLDPEGIRELITAIETLGIPVYLSGMARGLLGRGHRLQLRHKRRKALRDAELVLLAGVPCDFRLDYGAQIRRRSVLIAVNRSRADLRLNRKPTLAIPGDPARFLITLARSKPDSAVWSDWLEELRGRDEARNNEIEEQAGSPGRGGVNPLALCCAIEGALDEQSVLVADGGDFVGTAAYTVSPRGPLSWLDPGVFGTLGVGAGFALGAKLCRPESEVWILYGDGSAGYSLSEFDTFVRHQIPVLALVGNDGCWMQIAREQLEIFHDDVGVALTQSDYHKVVEGFGAKGVLAREASQLPQAFEESKASVNAGVPTLLNVHLGKTDFRKGSISM